MFMRGVRTHIGLKAQGNTSLTPTTANRPIDIPLHVRWRWLSSRPVPNGETVTGGVPLPSGLCWSLDDVSVVQSDGIPVPFQLTVLDRWPDQSLRWLLLDLLMTGPGTRCLRLFGSAPRVMHSTMVDTLDEGSRITVRTGVRSFTVAPGEYLFESTDRQGQSLRPCVTATDRAGRTTRAIFATTTIERNGPVRSVVVSEGTIAIGASKLTVSARLQFSAGSSAVQLDLGILNPRAAAHPGNFWELGDANSVLFDDLSIQLVLPCPAREIGCVVEPGAAPVTGASLVLYQDSSGGDNWRSNVHLNRNGVVPIRFNGYQLAGAGGTIEGRRASPAMCATYDGGTVSVATRHFWQNFPKALEADSAAVMIRLFPQQWNDLHELQGGERKTHTVAFAFDSPFPQALLPTQDPGVLSFAPEWYAQCEAMPSLTPATESQAPEYEKLIDAALEGEDTFAQKRERIDEYGWRNFGDIYADHEAIGHQGETGLVSHYNNQYDAIAGFAVQFMRSGDLRWFSAMEELARHVTDIDLYHTDEDKSAFSHGLFWHTAHYVDAGRSTHRTYPKVTGVFGGGPSNEHDYSTGLQLHHLLTGDAQSREGVVELVNWVMAMDDGRRTVFRFLSRGDTGLASATVSPDYHGPGRGAGNSIATLLNGFRLTQDRQFLAKAEALIRRCIHPADDIPARALLDAERRWSYTVFLQVLGKYLEVKALLGELDPPYEYARASLVHYAGWMAAHEYPYLDKPENLEYPNETWAAQDIRKAEIFATAARYGADDERDIMHERCRFFLSRSISMLKERSTRTLARPVVILLSNGHNIGKLLQMRSEPHSEHNVAKFPSPLLFAPQKAKAIRNGLRLAALSAAVLIAVISYVLMQILQ